MHPIERLRYVARASGADQRLIVQETATALASFGDDPQALVTACRRIVSRQPSSGPLVWLAARVLLAGEPGREIWEAAGAIQADATPGALRHALPPDATVVVMGWPDIIGEALVARGDLRVLVIDVEGEGSAFAQRLARADVEVLDVSLTGLGAAVASSDLVLLESPAIGPTEALVVAGSMPAAAVGRAVGVPVWLVAGVGRLLPRRMWDALVTRVVPGDAPWAISDELLSLDLVSTVVGPDGPEPVADALRRVDCPVVPELFRGDLI
jgi:hypothetical protein